MSGFFLKQSLRPTFFGYFYAKKTNIDYRITKQNKRK